MTHTQKEIDEILALDTKLKLRRKDWVISRLTFKREVSAGHIRYDTASDTVLSLYEAAPKMASIIRQLVEDNSELLALAKIYVDTSHELDDLEDTINQHEQLIKNYAEQTAGLVEEKELRQEVIETLNRVITLGQSKLDIATQLKGNDYGIYTNNKNEQWTICTSG